MNKAITGTQQGDDTTSGAGTPARILIVEDSKGIRELIFAILTNAGYECRAVSSGREALALLNSGERFDLMLCDLLNNPHGITLLDRTQQNCPRMPVIISTILKETVTEQRSVAETQLAALDAETAAMQTLMEGTQREIVDLAGMWNKGGAQQRQELAFSLYPDGLFYSRELRFFEPRNTLLVNAIQDMIAYLRTEYKIGVGNGNRTRNRRSHSPVLCQLSYSHRRG
jgi:CheY-like chemotaxis protein